jgi:NADH-quinone oxidoreductase subunit I
MEAPPHPMRLGETERDYYELGASGIVGGSPPAGDGEIADGSPPAGDGKTE